MLLIATDEAGYGPKLGPLVIAATVWQIPGDGLEHQAIDALFAQLRKPAKIGATKIRVDDSKSIFKPGTGLASLHAVVSASHHACGRRERSLQEMLPRIAADDLLSIKATPWLHGLSDAEFLDVAQTSEWLSAWQSTGIRLVDVQSRIITAAKFNEACADGANKADLLSESTIGLAKLVMDRNVGDETDVAIYCDRHGGRRYYSGVLGHVFADAAVQVIVEAKQHSAYRMTDRGKTIEIAFTVKGDSFTPVALASMHAKYLRERMMESLNGYFAGLHPQGKVLVPTAGYPVDADRFLADIAATIHHQKIDPSKLIRSR
ncbi:ribonuclease H family protein [Rubripirellula reticaptiva]|uniref:Uncharacterized protein n=1 Tax=Rubripirellula reticaptiva TaxID=2528013 RepID=A0A5C6EMW8_9BACT|nr:hypothetical protein [Rubripirellula reticaptiva]TWU49704.1 hypothetical protein Poly59_43280 [Rubripirellula reticaptiva]